MAEPVFPTPPLEDFNKWADFWYYEKGVNVIPADTMHKKTYVQWKRYQTTEVSEEQLAAWKAENAFKDGLAIIPGKVWRGAHRDEHLIFIDLDNAKAISEFCACFKDSSGNPSTLKKQIAERFIVEQHEDDPTKAHVFFYSEIMFPKKSSDIKAVGEKDDELPTLEIKGSGLHGIAYATPSFHKNGHRYKIIGTVDPVKLSEDQAQELIERIGDICRRHGLHYLEWDSGDGNAQVPITELFKKDFVVLEKHNRHGALLRVIESLIKRNYSILTPEEIREYAYNWNQKHCVPPLDDKEFDKQWKDGAKWILPKIKEGEKKEQEQERKPEVELTEELTREASWDDIAKPLETSVKKDWSVKVISFNGMLLTQTNADQINVGYQSESAAGKSYIAIEIAGYFPKGEVMIIASASPTAFFHDSGIWDKERNALIVDLRHKILIFLDNAHYQLLEKLRPLLSHDKDELQYKITDKSQKYGLRTKNVIIKGPPSVFFCTTKVDPDEQEKTRMILLSPSTDPEKLRESLELIALRKSDPEAYRKRMAEDSNRIWLINRINALRQWGIREIVIPGDGKAICEKFINEREHLVARHQRDFPRIFSFIKTHALFNAFNREKPEGKPDTIIANEKDIEAGFALYKEIEQSNELGLSPFIYRIYKEVIEPQLDSAIGLSRKKIRSKYHSVFHKTLTTKFEDSILMQMEAAGLITQEPDPDDKRKMLVYPTVPGDIS
jgi:hypothetical protein